MSTPPQYLGVLRTGRINESTVQSKNIKFNEPQDPAIFACFEGEPADKLKLMFKVDRLGHGFILCDIAPFGKKLASEKLPVYYSEEEMELYLKFPYEAYEQLARGTAIIELLRNIQRMCYSCLIPQWEQWQLHIKSQPILILNEDIEDTWEVL